MVLPHMEGLPSNMYHGKAASETSPSAVHFLRGDGIEHTEETYGRHDGSGCTMEEGKPEPVVSRCYGNNALVQSMSVGQAGS